MPDGPSMIAASLVPHGARAGAVGGRALLAVALGVLVAACDVPLPPAPSPSPSTARSGVRGMVLIGTPCASPGAATCFGPYVARLVILDADGAVVGETRSAASGAFEVQLPPGVYTIAPEPGGDPYPDAPLQSVSVVEGDMAEVEIRYDPGSEAGP